MLIEDGDSILKYLQGVSLPEIKFGRYFSRYFLTQEAVHLLVHFKLCKKKCNIKPLHPICDLDNLFMIFIIF